MKAGSCPQAGFHFLVPVCRNGGLYESPVMSVTKGHRLSSPCCPGGAEWWLHIGQHPLDSLEVSLGNQP